MTSLKETAAKKAFATAFAIGTTIIWFGQDHRNWTVVGAILVILGYARWASAATKESGNSQQHADSVYYLGFLLTLIALVSAFAPLTAAGGKVSETSILQQFGVGLITTICGLGARIYLSHFSEADEGGVVALHEQNAIRMATVARSLEQLESRLTVGMTSFATTIETRTGEIFEVFSVTARAVNASIEEAMRQNAELTRAQLVSSAQQFGGALTGLAAAVNKVDLGQLDLGKHFDRALQGVNSEIGRLQSAVAEVTGATVGQAGAVVESTKKLKLLNERLAAMLENHKNIGDVVVSTDQTATTLVAIGVKLEALANDLTTATESVGQVKHLSGEWLTAVKSDLTAIQTHRIQLEAEVRKTQAINAEVSKALLGSARLILDQLNPKS